MTEKARDLVTEWTSRLNEARRIRKRETPSWKRFNNYFINNYYEESSLEDRIAVNYLFSMVKVYLDTTFNRNPHIYVRPTPTSFSEVWLKSALAQIIEVCINYLWRELNVKRTIKRCIQGTTLNYMSGVEIYYNTEFAADKEVLRVVNERPVVRYAPAINILGDPNALAWDDESYWRAFERYYPMAYVKREWPKAYEHASIFQMEQTLNVKDKKGPTKELSKEDPMARARCTFIQDLRNNKLLMLVDGYNEDFVRNDTNPYLCEGFLSEILTWNDVDFFQYGVPDARQVEHQQLELNKIRTMMMKHVRRFNRKYGARKDVLSDADKQKLQAGDDGAIVEIDGEMPRDFQPIQDAPMSQDVSILEERIKQDYRDISAISEYYHGGAIPRVKTAYETEQIVAGTQIRLGGIAGAVEDFSQRVARKLIQIIIQYWSPYQVARVAGPGAIPIWSQIRKTREFIQGEFDVVVHAGSTMPPNEDRERALATQFYQMFRPDPAFDQKKIAIEAMKMWGKPNPEDFLKQQEEEIQPFEGGIGGGAGREASGGIQGIVNALQKQGGPIEGR